MLKDAASKAKPTKYVQNKCHGTNEGTRVMMPLAAAKCSAPNTAKGRAKHKLLKTTTLSRPLARAISLFAAHSAIRRSTMAAMHIEVAVRENARNMARMVGCMWMPRRKLALYQEPGSIQRFRCTWKVCKATCLRDGLTPRVESRWVHCVPWFGRGI